jgi:glyoxylase I family protein
MSQLRLEHIGLAARDPRTLKEWYERVLAARLVLVLSDDPPAFLIDVVGTLIEIYSADSVTDLTRNNKLAGWRHIALGVTSLSDARRVLEQRGLKFTEAVKPAGGGGQVLFFSDPEGNLFHLVERPQGWRHTPAIGT